MNLSLEPLKMDNVGDIVPTQICFSVKSEIPLGHALRQQIIYDHYTVTVVTHPLRLGNGVDAEKITPQ